MIKQFKYKNTTWVNVTSPTPEEISDIADTYGIHPVAAHEMSTPSQRSKVDVYDNFIYLILHFPHNHLCNAERDKRDTHEIDFIVGKDFIITTCYENVEPLQEFAQIFEANAQLDKSKKDSHAGFLFYYIIRHLYQSLEAGLDTINSALRRAERNVFAGHEREMVMVLSNINKDLLDFRWAMKSHREVLHSFELAGRDFYGENFSYYLKSITGEFERIWNQLESNRDTFSDLRNTNESLLSIKTNETMKGLTIAAVILLPVSVIAAIFGMSLDSVPLHTDPNGFFILIGFMVLSVALLYSIFKYRKWI